MRISLRQLAVFDAVARHANVSRGAADVAISQPAASMALKELEAELGTVLFRRNGRKLTLNENGRRLQPMARSLLSQAREIERIAGSEELTGMLHIAATDSLGEHVVGALCASFLRDHPAVQIKLEIVHWATVLDRVEFMACDLGLVEAPSSRAGLSFEALDLHDDLTLFVSPDHPFAARGAIALRDLASARWCLREVGSSTRHLLLVSIGAEVPDMPTVFESNSNAALKAGVRGGLGVGCLPRSVVEDEIADGAFVELKVRGLRLERTFGLLSPIRTYGGSLSEAFRAFARENVPTLAARLQPGPVSLAG